MCRAVTIERECFDRVFRGDDLQWRISREGVREIDEPVSDLSCQRRFSQARGDQRRNVANRRARGHTSARSIWQRHVDLRHSGAKY
jgi:hypothetical protein